MSILGSEKPAGPWRRVVSGSTIRLGRGRDEIKAANSHSKVTEHHARFSELAAVPADPGLGAWIGRLSFNHLRYPERVRG